MKIEWIEHEKGKGYQPIPLFYVLFFIFGYVALHVIIAYSLYSGNMIGRNGIWIGAKNSAPIFFWVYIVALGSPALIIDGFLGYKIIRRSETKRTEPVERDND